MKKPTVHNMSEFKEARKAFQGINSTPKKSLEKSKRRMAEKMHKHAPKYPRDFISEQEAQVRDPDYPHKR